MNASRNGDGAAPRPAIPTVRKRGRLRSAVGAVVGLVPTVVVFALIGAVGWWGHAHEWKVPKLAELRGEVAEADDWCDEHNVPESVCVECDPTLMPMPKARGVCHPHGLAECVLCHPELAEASIPSPTLDAARDHARRFLDFAPRPTNNPVCRTHLRRVQFTTPDDADKAGVAVEPVTTAATVEFVVAAGELGFDRTRTTQLSAKAAGTVREVRKRAGDRVAAGDVVAVIEAPEVGKVKAEVRLATADLGVKTQTVARLTALGTDGQTAKLAEAKAEVQAATIRLETAKQTLVNLGLPATAADAPTPAGTPSGLLPVVAAAGGLVVSPDLAVGEATDPTRVLVEVVDPASLWLTLAVKAEDAGRIKVGQLVRFRPDGADADVTAAVARLDAQTDPRTRTVKVRADVANPDGRLRANTSGTARLILRDEPTAVSVATEAVQWDGDCHVVFVRDRDWFKDGAPKVFHVRKVRVGAKGDRFTEVVGVLPGEVVATAGSGVLLGQLQKAGFGAGCACHGGK